MILSGEKVILRPLSEKDFGRYFKWHSDPEIRFQTAMHPLLVTEQKEREWFNLALNDNNDKRVILSIDHKANNELIGYFQLTDINTINRNALLGIVIGENSYQKIGLDSEIIQLGTNYGFRYLNLNKISLEVIKDNSNAMKLYKKIGFTKEGVLKNHYYFNGSYIDIIRMSLFANSI
jgi:RimJ/RimL family protein N-acetyltransferase